MREVNEITYYEALPIRQKVLRPHMKTAECIYLGDKDPKSTHFSVVEDDETIAIASIYNQPMPNDTDTNAWRIRGMATLPTYRKTGCGDLLIRACLDYAKVHTASYVWCNGRTKALGFYEKYGFYIVGEEFELPNIGPHYILKVDL